ncbi:MAG: PAS domain S-box protein [Sphingobacteriaceae bacterium]
MTIGVPGSFPQIASHGAFRKICDIVNTNVLGINQEGIIIYANRAEIVSVGCSAEGYIDKPFNLFYTDEIVVDKILKSIESKEELNDVEAVLHCNNGYTKHVSVGVRHLQDLDGVVVTYLFVRDVTVYKKNENLLWYLNEATEVLAGTRDTTDALNKISELIVPRFANWFTIDVLKNGELEMLKIAHEDPEHIKIALEYREKYPTDLSVSHGAASVVKTGIPYFVPSMTDERLEMAIHDEEQLRITKSLGIRSVITVAMFNNEVITGVVMFVTSESGKIYDEADLRFAQNFANHIGLALENARLNEEAIAEIESRKKVEEELKRTQLQLKSALSSGLIGTWVRDLKNNVMYADESLCKIFDIEYSPEGVDPYIFIKRIHPDDFEASEQKRKESIESGSDYENEYRILNNKGEVRWVFARGKTHCDEDGNVLSFAGVVGDITQRKLAEQALKESEERFRLMAESMPQKIFVTDDNARLLYISPQWEEFTGCSLEKINELSLAYFIHPDDLEENLSRWAEAVKTGHEFEYEHRFKCKDGNYYWHLTRALALRDSDGKNLWIGSITNIDDQNQNEHKKDEFISIASHELKTPITSLRGYLQILLRKIEKKDFSSMEDLVSKTHRQAHKLSALISDLLDVSKMQGGKMNYNFSEFEFSEIVEDAITDSQNNYSTHKVIVEGNPKVTIYGDKHRLEQVLSNLLSNAAKYSPDATEISFSFSVENDMLTVAVKDYGVGIPEEQAAFVFNRFFRVEETSYKFTGLGIGLFISHEIIQRHKGTLSFESKVGEGSKFWFSIPLNMEKEQS